MNSYKRIRAVLEGRKPDCVPVMLHNFLMAIPEAGYTHEQYRNSPRIIADTYIRAVEKYQYDGIVVDIDTATLAGAVGVKVDFPQNDPARAYGACLNAIEDVSYLKKIDITDYKYVNIWLEAVRLLKDYFRDEVFIRGNCDQAPFSLASIMRSPQEWMMDIMDEEKEGYVIKLLEYCTEITSRFVILMAEAGAHCVSNGDSPAGPSMISPHMYQKLALPYEKRISETAHKKGVFYMLHICGNTTAILDKIVECGADAVELDYLTDIRKAHDILKDKMALSGNIDPVGVISCGNTAEVEGKAMSLLELYSDSPRLILAPGCAIPANTPSENIYTLVKIPKIICGGN